MRRACARWIITAFFVLARAAQAQGNIALQVVDAASRQPIAEARAFLLGTTLGGVSNAQGRVLIHNVPPGTYKVRVVRHGYAEHTQSIVTGAADINIEVALRQATVRAAHVFMTPIGVVRREEINSSAEVIEAAPVVGSAAVTTMDELLTARVAGVSVTRPSQTGGGGRIRIRGTHSILQSNEPIYVIDGLRMTGHAGSSNLITGGVQPSRLNDLNPEEIESVEALKGPSSTALYGMDAANGVVFITTKRGRPAGARWTAYAEAWFLKDRNAYPTAYSIFGKRAGETTSAPMGFCSLPRVSSGECSVDSVASLNLFDDPDLSPLATGNRSQYGCS